MQNAASSTQKLVSGTTIHALPITFHVSRFTPRVSRITHHASRITLPVSRFTFHLPRPTRAFTLIELLVVISVIALLAALTFPAVRGAKLSVMRSRARGEMTLVETAIERYKDKLGYYPPDNPGNPPAIPPNWALNQLYYELLGTTNIGSAAAPIYSTLDDSSRVKASDFGTIFGPGVTGFMNCSRASRGDEPSSAMSFLTGLKPGQCMVLTNPTGPLCTILVCALEGPPALGSPGSEKINPWRYNSSSPRHNTKSFDLWIDVTAGNKTNRICNWSDKPITVYYTSIDNAYP
jgi:prepilin-type N-terminal cleavage/methylation domain-containing protein